MRLLLSLLFFILVANLCFGDTIKHAAPKHEKAILKTDTSAVSLRHFDAAALKAYSKNPEFQYNEPTTDLSWWARFWRWFWALIRTVWEWFTNLFDFSSLTKLGIFWQIIKILLLAAGLAALVFFILKSAGIDMLGIFRRKAAAAPIPYSEFFEDINQIDFDAEIENAVSKHNYRFAVRLLYLKCLKQLSDAGLIAWQIDKTNNVYIDELSDEEQRSAFKVLTRQFEYVWYGDFLIDQPVYKDINLSFNDFNKRVA
jgi:hypothetical protein